LGSWKKVRQAFSLTRAGPDLDLKGALFTVSAVSMRLDRTSGARVSLENLTYRSV
jgi:hypothetical protein